MGHVLAHRCNDNFECSETPGISLGTAGAPSDEQRRDGRRVPPRDRVANAAKHIVFDGEFYDIEDGSGCDCRENGFLASGPPGKSAICAAFAKWGALWPQKVNGVFAAALWDGAARRLYLWRDRFGTKPLYYSLAGGDMIFASEIKALLAHSMVSSDLDFASLGRYFALKNTSAPRTAYAKIRQVMPGQCVCWRDGEVNSVSYWSIDFSPLTGMDVEEAARETKRLFENAVRRRLALSGDEPAACLSGGVDSSAVAVLASRFDSRRLRTFSLGYADAAGERFAGKNADLEYARKLAREIGSDHHEFLISAGDFRRSMPDVLKAFDEPFSGTVSAYFLASFLAPITKSVLTGDGADELFASYLTHRLAFPMEKYLQCAREGMTKQNLPEERRKSLHPFDDPGQLDFLAGVASPIRSEWLDRLAVFSTAERKQLLKPDVFPEEAFGNPYLGFDGDVSGALDPLNGILAVDQSELLPNQVLAYMDRLSMAHSVTLRCPFLDHHLAEFVNRLPGNFKIRAGTNKFILKKALAGVVPQSILNRRKEGFVQPIYAWMHGELGGWVAGLLETLPGELFNKGAVAAVAKRFRDADESVNAKVWNLACFSLWWSAGKK